MNKMLAQRYMIVFALGEGGMADVYLGIDTILNREVAIKILRGELANDPITLLRFQREAGAASKLSHPNVVEVYDVGESEGRHYIVMEYVRGRTLKQLISQRGALHKEEAVEIMKQLVSAISAAHENNIIHRDIKPQNVLVKDDGTVKITDFGIALANDAVQLTSSDSVLGSAHYLAPETTRGEPATNQIDIYALGIVFYELLCGDVPFHGENPVQIAMKHLHEEMPSIKEFNPTLPQSIENIIIKATAKNKAMRYKSAKSMLADLEKCLLPQYQNVAKLTFDQPSNEPTRVMNAEKERVREVEQSEDDGHKKKTVIAVLVLLLSAIALLAVLYFGGILDSILPAKMITVVDVSNQQKDDAIARLEKAGFVIGKIDYELSEDIEKGYVIETSPAAEKEAKKGSSVDLVVSKGLYYIAKNYTGESIDAVKAELEEAGVSVKIVINQVPSAKSKGTILKQSGWEKGDRIDPEKGGTLTFEVADYPQFTIDASLKGMPIEEAAEKLRAQGAKVITSRKSTLELSEEELAAIETGVVVESDPAIGTLYTQDESSVITLFYY